ncbi:MAG: glycosyltransferase [Myxococcales bacterium]|nr:glycosyltransferase [Myxococcales bacterium]
MILHVACLPFPSHQGTQAALAAMLEASAGAGRPTHVLTYAHGAYERDAPYVVHRIPDFPRVHALRSGPSCGKVVLDARCIAETRRLARRLRPRAIVAHHIEAALAVLAARVTPVYYVAHTSVADELPVYFPSLPAHPVRAAARQAERLVCRRAAGIGAIAPALAHRLGEGARYLPVPWPHRTVSGQPTRTQARAALGLALDAPVCLYAGNLDRYQGWEHLLQALVMLRHARPNARLLVATESDPASARREAERFGVGSALRFCRLDGERARQLAHAAADLAWIPRRTAGGLPIKMLDAFARGLPVVAMARATAGLPLGDACLRVPNDDAGTLALAARRLLDDDRFASRLKQRAHDYLQGHHSVESFSSALRELLGETRATPGARPAEPHRRAAPALRARSTP